MELILTQLVIHKKSKTLEVEFSNGECFNLSFEYLRVFTPSAERRAHGAQEKLVVGKQDINIIAIEPVGNYGIKPIFDDGHNSGIFSWKMLHELGLSYEKNWKNYLEQLKQEQSHEPGCAKTSCSRSGTSIH